ncbi:hypothetical protein FRAAL0467 [Frankia alni ACN14a]|uniref:Uncharacterized protein n=1 Tax=Frankia alni (strain DSM 45986 / CECT 9034 / ACN14a) TaxID=326424 RepID=Q0RTF7_FRAAA|nr:hypothetical protein FRAAL0467 [Frankia alni ACN14a]
MARPSPPRQLRQRQRRATRGREATPVLLHRFIKDALPGADRCLAPAGRLQTGVSWPGRSAARRRRDVL